MGLGAIIDDNLVALAQRDSVFSMVLASDDVKQALFGDNGISSGDAKQKNFRQMLQINSQGF